MTGVAHNPPSAKELLESVLVVLPDVVLTHRNAVAALERLAEAEKHLGRALERINPMHEVLIADIQRALVALVPPKEGKP